MNCTVLTLTMDSFTKSSHSTVCPKEWIRTRAEDKWLFAAKEAQYQNEIVKGCLEGATRRLQLLQLQFSWHCLTPIPPLLLLSGTKQIVAQELVIHSSIRSFVHQLRSGIHFIISLPHYRASGGASLLHHQISSPPLTPTSPLPIKEPSKIIRLQHNES